MILGIDEVGRGPWAGPLVLGGVILPDDKPSWVSDLTDSKKLSAKKREELSKIIEEESPATALGWVSSRELDSLGMSESLRLAARRLLENIKSCHVPFSEIIIDGTGNFLINTPFESHVSVLKKADFLIKEVSAASIIAKVARDSYMTELAKLYPDYGFDRHVGYGTAAHKKAIETYGLTPEHRRSFRPIAEFEKSIVTFTENPSASTKNSTNSTKISAYSIRQSKNLTQDSQNLTTKQLGDRAESIVASYLEENGHRILTRNHKTPFYEIDIVSVKADKIYFTEVKYRKSDSHGTSLDMITKEKYRQMSFAAESFLKFQPFLKKAYSPLLAAATVSGHDFHFDSWFPLSDEF